jgi:hypothetical protein
MFIYSMDANSVDTVFFAVVPDSFMNRGPKNEAARVPAVANGALEAVVDTPFLAPRDPWSF